MHAVEGGAARLANGPRSMQAPSLRPVQKLNSSEL